MTDLRIACRQLLKSPGYSAIVVATLGLGIGLVTTQFSLVDGVLLRPMPFPEAARLQHVGRQSDSDLFDQWQPMPMRDFLAYRERQTTFEDLAAFHETSVNVSRHGGPAQRHAGAAVSANFFEVLRAQPLLGRSFRPGEDRPGTEALAVVGHELWQQELGGSADVLGRVIHLNGEPATLIGVMPPAFQFPLQQALWTNLREGPRDPREGFIPKVEAMGRLKPGVSKAQAAANLGVIARQLEETFPETNRGLRRVSVQPFARAYAGVGAQSILLTLLAMTLFVLLLGCANVTNLMLARLAGRTRDLAVRAALGAGRGRLIRQVLVESCVLAAAGALAGILLSTAGVALLNNQVLGHMDVPFYMRFELNWPILAATAGLTLLAGLAAGLAPAVQAGRTPIHDALKDGGRGDSGLRSGRFMRALVVAQVALACALVVAAAMMAENVIRARTAKLTYDPEALLIGRLELSDRTHPDKADRVRFYSQLLDRLREVPGVDAVAVSSRDLVNAAVYTRFEKEGETYAHANDKPGAWLETVSREYFSVVGAGALEGRLFDATDAANGPAAAVVNASFARRHWPGESALGKRLRRDEAGATWATVVGVVPDLYLEGLSNNDPPGGYYLLQDQQGWGWMHLLVRGRAPAATLIPALRAAVSALDPDQPIHSIATLSFHADRRLRAISLVGTMAGVFAVAAAGLAAVGIYGVMALTVSRRTREFGIRMALGAGVNHVLRLVLGLGLRQLLLGLGLGLLLAFALSRPLAPLLSGGVTGDPRIYGGVAAVIGLVALLACWLPARRAARVDPIVALRSE